MPSSPASKLWIHLSCGARTRRRSRVSRTPTPKWAGRRATSRVSPAPPQVTLGRAGSRGGGGREKECRHADRVHTFRALDRLLPQADFVVLAVPLPPETRNLLSRERLDLLKPDCGVINIARAPVMDYAALADKLRTGGLAGAMVDVAEPEPLPPESTLWDVPNLIITPHISCDDFGNYAQLTLDLVFENLGRLMQHRPLRNRVSRTRGY